MNVLLRRPVLGLALVLVLLPTGPKNRIGFGSHLANAAESAHARASILSDGKAVLAIVRDSPSLRFDDVFRLIGGYLRELAGDDYKVEIRDPMPTDFSVASIRARLLSALNDPTVEIVYTGGMIASELAGTLPGHMRTKPVLAGFPELSEGDRFLISTEGYSTAANFTFVSTPRRVASDLLTLKELTSAETLHLIVDSSFMGLRNDWRAKVAEMEKEIGAKLAVYGADDDAAAAIALLPDDARAVYVSILPRFSENELGALYRGLQDRGCFAFSMIGPSEIPRGAAATLASELGDAISRRTALNLHQLFLGVPTSELQVYLPNQDQLLINNQVIRALGWSPDYDTFLSAQFVGEEGGLGAPTLTLEQAMETAAKQNAETRSQAAAAAVSRADLRLARGLLLPQVALKSGHFRSDISHEGTNSPRSDGYGNTLGVELEQVLFDDSVWSGFQAQKRSTAAAELDLQSATLDARAAAGSTFLNYLRQQVLYAIEKENLGLTENNRRLAQLRVDIGTAEPSEIFRWESEVARDRADLLRRRADRDNAHIELNRILGAPRTKAWSTTPIELAENDYYFLGNSIGTVLNQQSDLDALTRFVMEIAVTNSPELAAFDRTLEAAGIQLRRRKRAYYVPRLGVRTGYDRSTNTGDILPAGYANEWSMGLEFTLPLFEGGRRSAEIDRQQAVVRQLEAQRDLALQIIEQEALSNVNLLRADHANLRLSRRAMTAAQRNYDSVLEKYSNGAATILDTLDAQSGLLLQRQQSASATYDYLTDVIALQRAVSWFESASTREEREDWANRLRTAVAGEQTTMPEAQP